MENNLDKKEKELMERLEKIKNLEKQVKEKEKAKKQILLRLSPGLWNELAAWADEDFRSINGQIEYLLADCVRKKKGKS